MPYGRPPLLFQRQSTVYKNRVAFVTLTPDGSVERSLYIDDTLYTISGGMIKMNGLGDLSEIGRVDLG